MNRIILVVLSIMALISANNAAAVETSWTGTTGDWFSNSWDNGVPGYDVSAYIANGGTVAISGGNAEAEWLYLGDRRSGNMILSSGQLTVSDLLFVGYYREGSFIQSGGYNSNRIMYVGEGSTNGEYNLSDGQLNSDRQIFGSFYGSGVMNQSGGFNTSDIIEIGTDGMGFYNISGGSLTVSEMIISNAWGGGLFNITDSAANITITDRLHFDGHFSAAAGSIINMEGASLDIDTTHTYLLMGLNNVNMVFNGGAGTSTIEVADQDIGSDWGRNEYVAFDTFTLGQTSTADVQLVNNHNNTGGTEALYSNNCVFGAGSSLDLNGINLYCNYITDHGATIHYNGGQLIQTTPVVPEPISSILFVTGGTLLAGRRFIKRKKTA